MKYNQIKWASLCNNGDRGIEFGYFDGEQKCVGFKTSEIYATYAGCILLRNRMIWQSYNHKYWISDAMQHMHRCQLLRIPKSGEAREC